MLFWLIFGTVVGFFAGAYVTDQAWKHSMKDKRGKDK